MADEEESAYQEFMRAVDNGNVREAYQIWEGNRGLIDYMNGPEIVTAYSLFQELDSSQVTSFRKGALEHLAGIISALRAIDGREIAREELTALKPSGLRRKGFKPPKKKMCAPIRKAKHY